MKRILMIGLMTMLALAGCSTAQQQTAQQNAAKVQQIVADGCLILQPTLNIVQGFDPVIVPFVVANGAFCAAVSTVNVASIQTMVGTSIPQAIQLVQNSALIPADKKPVIVGAMTA